MNKENIEKKKRKRTANTTSEQYEEYLNFIENNYILRSGSVNPTLDDNYIQKKWQDLVEKLNSIGNGPQLSIEEWKKRMNDWKNSTRAKYRKVYDSRIKTGGGEGIKIKLTPLEERGLAAWGKVAVSGCKDVPETGGLFQNNTDQEPSPVFENKILEDVIIEENIIIEDNVNISNNNISHNIETTNVPKIKQTRFRKRVKPLNETAQTLLQSYGESLIVNKALNTHFENFIEKYSKIEEAKLDLEREKFKFEVAKYKFENNGFQFDMQL